MRKLFTITIAGFLFSLTVNAQTLFIIGERSYPCTDVMTFKSEAEDGDDLDVVLAKEGEFGYLGVSKSTSKKSGMFIGKLMLHLEGGNVITCYKAELSEEMDDRAKALYPLTMDQLSKLKNNTIYTIKYIMMHDAEVQYTVSNTGAKTIELISALFGPTDESPAPPVIEEPKGEEPFAYVERMPSFPDGSEAMYKYIYDTMEYPATARESKISGQVIVQFVVSADGEIQKAKVVRGIGGGCNEEALRIVNSMPNWNPGMHNGRSVPVTFTLPIKFVIQ